MPGAKPPVGTITARYTDANTIRLFLAGTHYATLQRATRTAHGRQTRTTGRWYYACWNGHPRGGGSAGFATAAEAANICWGYKARDLVAAMPPYQPEEPIETGALARAIGATA